MSATGRVSSWPLLDRAVYRVVGDAMLWLGKRAWRRGDVEFYDAMRAALAAGHVKGRLKPAPASGPS